MSGRPVKRRRSTAAKSRTASTRRNRNSIDMDVVINSVYDDTTCIDLTREVDEEVVDLTAVDSPTTSLGTRVSGSRPVAGRRRRLVASSSAQDCQCAAHSTLIDSSNITCGASASNNISTKNSKTPTSTKESDMISCPICLDTMSEILKNQHQVMSTICGHIFCDMCIVEIIKATHRCPTCRKKLTNRQVHPIFL